jgi:hypothetical protein
MTVATDAAVRFETDTELRHLAWARRDRARFVDVPEKRYLVIDGTDVPGGDAYRAAIGGLYGAAYGLHFGLRGRGIRGHRVGAFGALYWLTPEQLAGESSSTDAAVVDWRWRLLIDVPDEATDADVQAARERIGPAASQVALATWTEGHCGQILHVGSYGSETPTIRRLHEAMAARGLRPVGPLHEIYLNDPRRVGEENAKTLLRQVVEPIR